MLRAAFSLTASFYIFAALLLPAVWLAGLHLTLGTWWGLYAVTEIACLGLPLALALWVLVWRPAAQIQRVLPSRLVASTAMGLVPLFGFLVIPVGCFVSLPGSTGVIAGVSVFAASALAAFGYWQYARTR